MVGIIAVLLLFKIINRISSVVVAKINFPSPSKKVDDEVSLKIVIFTNGKKQPITIVMHPINPIHL